LSDHIAKALPQRVERARPLVLKLLGDELFERPPLAVEQLAPMRSAISPRRAGMTPGVKGTLSPNTRFAVCGRNSMRIATQFVT